MYAASAAARRARASRSLARTRWCRAASLSWPRRASAVSSACARSPLAHSQTRIWAISCEQGERQALVDGLVGVRPSALPESELGDEREVGGRRGGSAHGRPRGLEMRAGRVEPASTHLQLGPRDERLVRVVGGDPANGGRAHALGVVPLAARHQRLDVVRDAGCSGRGRSDRGRRARPRPPAPTPGAAPTSSARH